MICSVAHRATFNTMPLIALERSAGLGPQRPRWRRSQHRCATHNGPENRPYRLRVSDEVARARWSKFVARALEAARVRGMTDKDIQQATGLQPTTWHRWKRGQTRTAPDITKVRAFCRGLGLNVDDALAALGMTGQRDNPAPEPPMDPDVLLLLRKLADPNVPVSEKEFIRESLRMLANRGRRRDEAAG